MAEIKELHAALESGRDAVRGRRDAGPGCGQHRQGLQGGAAAHRHRADQARRRLARRRGLSVRAGHRRADQVRRRQREDRRAGGVRRRAPCRPRSWAWATSSRWSSRSLPASTWRPRRSWPPRSRAARLRSFRLPGSQLQQMKKHGRALQPDGQAADPDVRPRPAASTWTRPSATCKRKEGIICSMTPLERRKPELIKATRKRRIAAGAGVQVQEVNRLLKEFEQMQSDDEEDEGRGADEDDEACESRCQLSRDGR
jgi:hypothetical protein